MKKWPNWKEIYALCVSRREAAGLALGMAMATATPTNDREKRAGQQSAFETFLARIIPSPSLFYPSVVLFSARSLQRKKENVGFFSCLALQSCYFFVLFVLTQTEPNRTELNWTRTSGFGSRMPKTWLLGKFYNLFQNFWIRCFIPMVMVVLANVKSATIC